MPWTARSRKAHSDDETRGGVSTVSDAVVISYVEFQEYQERRRRPAVEPARPEPSQPAEPQSPAVPDTPPHQELGSQTR